MRNKNFASFLPLVLVCSVILVVANEDQNEAVLRNSSIAPDQDDLPKIVRVLQLRKVVINGTAEEISEAVTEISSVKYETTEAQSSTTETIEDSSENVTTESSMLLKRQASAPADDDFFESELTLEQLQNYSCFKEASTFGHDEAIGSFAHEIICELRKLEHYFSIGLHNLKTEYDIELPVETEEIVTLLTDYLTSDAILDTMQQGLIQLETYLQNPEQLNELLDTIDKCLPMSNIHETVGRLMVAVTNFLFHLQGFVISFQPHQSIDNYREILKKFEETLHVLIENLSDSYDIHSQTKMDWLIEFGSLVGSFLKKFPCEQSVEENLTIFKEFLDNLANAYKHYRDSESLETVIDEVHAAISTFISKLFTKQFSVPIVRVELPTNNSGILSCGWQATSEISSKPNLTSLYQEQLSNTFDREAKIFSELSAPVELLHKNLTSVDTVEHHLTALKEFIDSLSIIYRKYYNSGYSQSVVDKVRKFFSILLLKDFDVPLFHIEPSNGSVVVSCSWQVVKESYSSSPLFSPELNLFDGSEDKTQSMTLAKLLDSENSMPISINDFSQLLPIADDTPNDVPLSKNDVPSSVGRDSLSQFSRSTVPSLIPTFNYGSPAGISFTTILPEITTKLSVRSKLISVNDASSSSANGKPSDRSIPSSVVHHPERVSPVSPTRTATILSTVFVHHLTSKQPHSENTDGRLDNNSAVSSITGKPTDPLTNNPQIVPHSPEEPADLSGNDSPIAASSPEEPADLSDNRPPSAASVPEEPADLPVNNPPIDSSAPEEPDDSSVNNSPIDSSVPEEPADLPVNNSPIDSSVPEEPAEEPVNNSPCAEPAPEEPVNNSPIDSSAPEEPADISVNNPPVDSSPPEEPADLPVNNPPTDSSAPEEPADLPVNNSPIDSSVPEEPVNNSPIDSSAPEEPADSSVNNSPVDPSAPEEPAEEPVNNSPIDSSAPEEPAEEPVNNSPIDSSAPEEPAEEPVNNSPCAEPAPEEPADLPINNSSSAAPTPEEPADLPINNPPLDSSAPEEPANLPPSASSSPQKLADLSSNSPPIASPLSDELADLLSNDSSIAPSPEQPPDLSTINLPGSPSISDKLVNPMENNSPVSSHSVGNPVNPPTSLPVPKRLPNSSPSNPQSPLHPSKRPTHHSANSPPMYPHSPERPTDLPVNNPPMHPSPPTRPSFPYNNPSIPSYFSVHTPLGFPPLPERPIDFSNNNQPVFPLSFNRPTDFSHNNQPMFPLLPDRPTDFTNNNPFTLPPHLRRPTNLPVNDPSVFLSPYGTPTSFSSNRPSYFPSPEGPTDLAHNEPVFPPVEKSSPSVLFPSYYGRNLDDTYDEPPSSYAPPSYLLPASDILPNLPHYPPYPETYANYLESADAFYKCLYSYLQYGNPAVAPPPSVSNKISKLLTRGVPPSLPMAMDNPNLCGTFASLPALSSLNNILKNGIRSSQLPLYVPRKEIASALGNTVLSPDDLIVIIPKNGVGLIGQVVDTFSPIHFKAYEVKTIYPSPRDGIRIWHLRSGDFRNPECEQQLDSLFQH